MSNEIEWGPSGEVVFDRTYSRAKPNGERESWPETVDRVVEGNLALTYGPAERGWTPSVWREHDELVDYIKDFRLLPAGRHLNASGVKGRQYLMNCWTSGWTEKLSDHYEFTFMRLMEGGGVGANYSTHHIEKYGLPRRSLDVHVVCDPSHPDYQDMLDAGLISAEYDADWIGGTQVEDSREGWAASLVELIDTYMDDGHVSHRNRVFDVSRVRARGARLKTFGGTASGPLPFAEMLHKVSDVLNGAHSNVADHLTPIQAMLIDHYVAECVVSGGTRRSARMAMIRWDDPFIHDFLKCKADTGEHWTTNISVEVDDAFFKALSDIVDEEFAPYEHSAHKHAVEVHQAVVEGMLTSGEPGYWNSALSNHGEVEEVYCTNPCGEITLQMWEACCLGHVNLDAFAPTSTAGTWNEGGLIRAHQLMTRFLIRATGADINDEKSVEVEEKNRRIGVGHLGVQGFIVKNGWRYSDVAVREFSPGFRAFRDLLDRMYTVVRGEARNYAFELRIPEPIKVTTVAPTGSVAKLPGVTEGIHTVMYRWFIRRIRFSMSDPRQARTVEKAAADGLVTEWDGQAADTAIVQYPTKDPLVAKVEAMGLPANIVETAEDLGVDTMLAFQAMYQRHYADNAVSFTVNVPAEAHQQEYMLNPPDSDPFGMSPPAPTEGRRIQVADVIAKYLPVLKGTTVMLDGSRQQAPYEKISEAQYEAATLKSIEDSVDLECATGACPI